MRRFTVPTTLSLLIAGHLLAISRTVYADNYMRSEGEGYYSAGLQYDTAFDKWNQDYKRVHMPCTANNWKLTQSYEYGLSYYNTVFGSIEYLDRSCGIYGVSGVGNLTLGIRRRLDVFRNGRSWEAEVIIPTSYSTTGNSTIGSGLYGLRLGVFGSFGDSKLLTGEPSKTLEMGANIYIWEGSASEQFSGYAKYNFLATDYGHFFAAIEGDYALNNRGQNLSSRINPVNDYGYDRLNARLGFSGKITLKWRLSIEGTNVLIGRYTNDSNSIKLMLSRNFLD